MLVEDDLLEVGTPEWAWRPVYVEVLLIQHSRVGLRPSSRGPRFSLSPLPSLNPLGNKLSRWPANVLNVSLYKFSLSLWHVILCLRFGF